MDDLRVKIKQIILYFSINYVFLFLTELKSKTLIIKQKDEITYFFKNKVDLTIGQGVFPNLLNHTIKKSFYNFSNKENNSFYIFANKENKLFYIFANKENKLFYIFSNKENKLFYIFANKENKSFYNFANKENKLFYNFSNKENRSFNIFTLFKEDIAVFILYFYIILIRYCSIHFNFF
ncbi:hypothetical protein NUSPORA_01440 [Nucleospora cyclopteri]